MDDERDALIDRAARALSPLRPLDARVAGRVLAVVRSRRGPSRVRLAIERLREPSLSAGAAGLLAAAALVIGFVSRGALVALDDSSGATVATSTPYAPGTALPRAMGVAAPARAAGVRREEAAVPVPIVFEARNAKSVAIVGDFNGWDPTVSPMQLFGSDGPWTATVLVTPGRHVYAFLVDGTTLVADPRAHRAQDIDYGGDASVLMVPSS